MLELFPEMALAAVTVLGGVLITYQAGKVIYKAGKKFYLVADLIERELSENNGASTKDIVAELDRKMDRHIVVASNEFESNRSEHAQLFAAIDTLDNLTQS